jgi:Restriction endonuclease BamHI
MKFIRTVVVFDRGSLIDSEPWARMHETITGAVQKIVHPPGNDRFLIRRKILKPDAQGKPSKQWMRNGVVPIKRQFLENLTEAGWRAEMPVGLGRAVLAGAEPTAKTALKEFPSKRDFAFDDANWSEVFREGLGDFDFYSESANGLRCVIEWETGNISSSHRSMNKLCLVMLAGLIDIGVVILPSQQLYRHLTDRIGNWEELSPYLALWHHVGHSVKRGLLAVTVVEHDELTNDTAVPFISQGIDGRSAEGASKLL